MFLKVFISFRIPSDFQWPKFDQSTSANTNRSSRIPLNTITNQISQRRFSAMKKPSRENILSPLSVIKIENHISIVNSNNNHQVYSNTNQNDFDVTSTIYNDQLQVN